MFGDIRALVIPKWGLTMTEGTLVKWHAEVGAKLDAGATVADIESSKIVNELQVHEPGILRRRIVEEGETCSVGALIGVMAPEGVADGEVERFIASFLDPGKADAHPVPTDVEAHASNVGNSDRTDAAGPDRDSNPGAGGHGSESVSESFATEYAVELARQLGIRVATATGTGRNGRITRRDVLRAIETLGRSGDLSDSRASQNTFPPPQSGRPATPVARRLARNLGVSLSDVMPRSGSHRIRKADVLAAASVPTPRTDLRPVAIASEPVIYQEQRFSPTRRVIAERLIQSKQLAPQFRLLIDVPIDELLKLKSSISDAGDRRISLNDLLVKAAAHALTEVPAVNIQVHGDRIRYFTDADIAVAVDTEHGLVAPIVRAANKKGIRVIARELSQLVNNARCGKLVASDVEGGTFSISNLGMYGIRQFDAIINPPQGAILATGAARKERVFRDNDSDECVATMMTVTLTCDHRAIDGVLGARFLQAFKRFVETPAAMLL